MRLTAPAERSPRDLDAADLVAQNSSGSSNGTVVAAAPAANLNGASARLCPRVEMACTKPLRAPSWGAAHARFELAALADAGRYAERLR